jgi:hypothetical protein
MKRIRQVVMKDQFLLLYDLVIPKDLQNPRSLFKGVLEHHSH